MHSQNVARTRHVRPAAPILLAVLFVVMRAPAASSALTSGVMIDLGAGAAYGINSVGQVVGLGQLPSGSPRAFLWSNGVITWLPTAGRALGINTAGQVVGYDGLPFLWSNGVLTHLQLPPGVTEGGATGINASGQVSGWYREYQVGIGNVGNACMWTNGVLMKLGSSAYGFESSAGGINDNGQVVGYNRLIGSGSGACVWTNGVPTYLGSLGGGGTAALCINAAGQVAGVSLNAGFQKRGFLWSNGAMVDLGTIGGNGTDARGINAPGQVVGFSIPSGGGGGLAHSPAGQVDGGFALAASVSQAFLWSRGIMADVGGLGPFGSLAYGINDAGKVVGESYTPAGVAHAFLWKPYTFSFYCDKQGDLLLAPPVLLSKSNDGGSARVCADGADAEIVTLHVPDFSNISNLAFRIKEDPGAASPAVYGQFTNPPTVYAADSLGCRYIHPSVPPPAGADSLKVTVEAYDVGSGAVLFSTPLSIFCPPVVLVHGWTGSPKAMRGLEQGLRSTGRYPGPLLTNPSYFMLSTRGFSDNKGVVPSFISATLKDCWNAGFAASKVDVIGHSYGGLLTRFYLQSAWGGSPDKKPYRGDIYRLITVDSPHSGSQAANYAKQALDAFWGHQSCLVMANVGHFLNDAEADLVEASGPAGWFSGQACTDLMVNSDAISLLNGSSLNRAIVPSRAEVCVGPMTDYIIKYDGSDGWAPFYVGVIGAANAIGIDAQAYVDQIYNGDESDFIVPVTSQYGGLGITNHLSLDTHGHAPSNEEVIDDIKLALNASPTNGAYWSTSGFDPIQLAYQPANCSPSAYVNIPGHSESHALTGGIITSPTGPVSATPGQQISVSLSGPPGTSSLLVIAGSPGIGGAMATLPSSSGMYTLQVPTDAVGHMGFLVAASGVAGILAIDSLDIAVTPTAALTGLSLQPASELQVYKDDQSCATLFGSYADNVTRGLTSVAGVTWWTGNSAIATVDSRGVVTGVLPGDTGLFASYQGDTASVAVHVVEGTGVSAVPPGDQVDRPQPFMLTISPNPGRGPFAVELSMPSDGNAKVEVFDVAGRLVRVLLVGLTPAGRQELRWDAKDARGETVASGVYYVRMRVGAETATRRMVLLR